MTYDPPLRPVEAVLFDRDGTLVVDVPYNPDPDRVELMPGAGEVVRALRATGVKVGVVTNQSGVGRGRITEDQLAAVNGRLIELLGGIDVLCVCPHRPDDGCSCRKPAPGLVQRACRTLGVAPEKTVVIGDIGSDVEAAHAAGAQAVIVPTPVTRPEEISASPLRASDLLEAVWLVAPDALGGLYEAAR